MNETTKTILIATLSSATVVGLLNFLIQLYFKHIVEKRIKKLEAELEKDNFRHSVVFPNTQKSIETVSTEILRHYQLVQVFLRSDWDSNSVESKLEHAGKYKSSCEKIVQDFCSSAMYIPKNILFPMSQCVNEAVVIGEILARLITLRELPEPKNNEIKIRIEATTAEVNAQKKKFINCLEKMQDEIQMFLGVQPPSKK